MTNDQFDIYQYMSEIDRPKVYGLQALIYMSLREQTSIAYQHEELNFSDIPPEVISRVDELSEEEQLYLAAQIADDIFEEDLLKARDTKRLSVLQQNLNK